MKRGHLVSVVIIVSSLLVLGCGVSAPPSSGDKTVAPNPTIEALTAEVGRIRAAATVQAAQLAATQPSGPPILEEAASRVKRYTVLVTTDTGTGSGTSLEGGLIVTSYHVVEDASRIAVRFASGEPLRVLWTPA